MCGYIGQRLVAPEGSQRHFDAEEKKVVKALLEGMILKHETKADCSD